MPDLDTVRIPMDGDLQGKAEFERATWLLDDEFDADVVVCEADVAEDEFASKAKPGKPATRIS